MAEVYYKIVGDTCYYCNEQKDGYEKSHYNNPYDHGEQYGHRLEFDYVNGKFILPSNSERLFQGITNTTIDLSHCDASELSWGLSMFNQCPNLIEIDLSTWNTPNLTATTYMFSECPSLTKLNVSGLDMTNVRYATAMFAELPALKEVDMGDFNIESFRGEPFGELFEHCQSLSVIKLPPNTDWYTDYDLEYDPSYPPVFIDCPSLPNLEGGNGTVFACNNVNNRGAFDVKITLYYWVSASNYLKRYGAVVSLKSKDVHYSNVKRSNSYKEWSPSVYINELATDFSSEWHGVRINYIIDDDPLWLPQDSTNIFRSLWPDDGSYYQYQNSRSGSYSNSIFDASKINTSRVRNFSYAFYDAKVWQLTGLQTWDMSKVEDMSYMFAKWLNGATYFTVGQQEMFSEQFYGNIGKQITRDNKGHQISDTTNWRLDNVTTMESLFDGSYNIHYQLITAMKNWTVKKCSNFKRMFAFSGESESFQAEIDLSGWNAAETNVNAAYMFYNFQNWAVITMPVTFSNAQIFRDVQYMFYNCSRVLKINAVGDTDWKENPTLMAGSQGYQMFYGCTNLETFDSTKTDIYKANTFGGYFNPIKIYEKITPWIHLPNGTWASSKAWIKDENNVWKASEVWF